MMQRVIKHLMRPALVLTAVFSACSTIAPPSSETVMSHDKTQRVLSGMLALVEAQHTYYVHVTRNTKFAANIRELGFRDDKGGTVMVLDVWNANDDAPIAPLEGYYIKVLPFANGPGEKDGFAVAAIATQDGKDLPAFLTIVKSVQGGIVGMCMADTWGIRDSDLIQKLRALLRNSQKLDSRNVALFIPSQSNRTLIFENFSHGSPPQ